MQDLLGLPIEFGARLPEDGKSKDGLPQRRGRVADVAAAI